MNLKPETYDILKEIIIAHLNYLNMVGQMGMLWWVSSTVFVFTLIKTFYNYKTQLMKRNLEKPIGVFITAFIVSIIVFGIVSCICLIRLETELRLIVIKFVEFEDYDISSMFFSTIIFLLIGTSSFIFFLIIWIIMWYHEDTFRKRENNEAYRKGISSKCPKRQRSEESRSL